MTALELARDERLDLADFLAGLTPEQWASPTLCEDWRVRDVAAHVVSFEGMTPGGLT
ncbi:MAG TPA: maleylpyruvate isomerase family mycothiol-dependent enzyme, partial [Mycobacterium sp.]